MSSGQQAISYDEDDWYDFKREAKIDANWKVYNPESSHAYNGKKLFNLTGSRLIRYVELMMEVAELSNEQRKEDADYAQFLQLQEKFKDRAK